MFPSSLADRRKKRKSKKLMRIIFFIFKSSDLEISACIGKPKNNDENGFFYYSKKIRGTKNALNLSSEPVDKMFILNQSALNESFQKTKDFFKATSKKFIDQTSNFVMKFKAPSKLNNSISDFKAIQQV